MELPLAGIGVCARELKILNAAIEVNQTSGDVYGRSNFFHRSASLTEVVRNEHLAHIIRNVPCDYTRGVAVAAQAQ